MDWPILWIALFNVKPENEKNTEIQNILMYGYGKRERKRERKKSYYF